MGLVVRCILGPDVHYPLCLMPCGSDGPMHLRFGDPMPIGFEGLMPFGFEGSVPLGFDGLSV